MLCMGKTKRHGMIKRVAAASSLLSDLHGFRIKSSITEASPGKSKQRAVLLVWRDMRGFAHEGMRFLKQL
eukprot:157797-Amphidinium_carterae.1